MKKIITMITMFMLFGMISFVSATDNSTFSINNENISNPTINAGSVPGDFFYAADRGLDNIKLLLTFNKEKKIEKSLDIAEERLAEAEILAERGDVEKAKIAQEGHDKFLEKAKIGFYEFETKDKNSLRDIAKIQDRIDIHEQKILDVKTKVFAKLSKNMTTEELAILTEVFANFEEKIRDARNNILKNKHLKEKIYQANANLTNKEISKLLNQINDEEGITENRKIRKLKENRYFDNKIKNLKDKLIKLENLYENENLSIKDKLRIQKKINEIKSDINEANVKKQEKITENLYENEDKEAPEVENEDKEAPEVENEDKEAPEVTGEGEGEDMPAIKVTGEGEGEDMPAIKVTGEGEGEDMPAIKVTGEGEGEDTGVIKTNPNLTN